MFVPVVFFVCGVCLSYVLHIAVIFGDCKLKKLKLSEELIEIKDKILKFRLAY